jgi:hypothetical protein
MQPPSLSSGQPALSVLVLLPASAHMSAQNASPLAPVSRPPPLTTRKSGSTVPSLKSINSPQNPSRLRYNDISPDEERSTLDPLNHLQVGRRSSLAPGLGAGTEVRAPDSRHIPRLGAIEPSPPGTPERAESPSFDDHSGDDRSENFGGYELSDSISSRKGQSSRELSTPVLPSVSTEAPAFGSRNPFSTSATSARTRRRPQTSATSRAVQGGQRSSMALPSGSGLGMGGGSGLRNRPGWEADEVVGHLRESGLEGMSPCPPYLSSSPAPLFYPSTCHTAGDGKWRHGVSSLSHPFTPVPKDTFRV